MIDIIQIVGGITIMICGACAFGRWQKSRDAGWFIIYFYGFIITILNQLK